MELSLRALAVAALFTGSPVAQVFADNPGAVPGGSPSNNSYTEDVDFGDVDLDGDWDAVFADGGDFGNDQNRIWINQGGAQGGTLGVFTDRTSALFPTLSDDSRGIELADIDGDGDLDIHVANTSQISNQPNRWWVNQGSKQGGTLGAYADETAARWVGIGGAGSSIHPALVLAAGGFVTWSPDGDFADFDDDGDLDLLSTTYGGAYSGLVPTRLFLNDGDGYFSEFNPSGFQLASGNLASGSPALWAEGLHFDDTMNATGAEADITSNGDGASVADQDGDFDLDVLIGTRSSGLPRFFRNRLQETGGVLAFRDVSTAVFPPNWAVGGSSFEQQLGDLDDDGDVDLYGVNWGPSFQERVFRNDGAAFGNTTVLPGSATFDVTGTFLDFDADGDLDLVTAGFSNALLHRNEDTGSGPVGFVLVTDEAAGLSGVTDEAGDVESADVDGDGDQDLMVAYVDHDPNRLFTNTTQAPDGNAPHLDHLEDLVDAASSTAPRSVRAHVYDSAPYYIAQHDDAALEVTVDGCRLPDFAMKSSGGQVFRGELPGNLLGVVDYRARAADEYGNTGFSALASYTASFAGTTGGTFGADSGAAAPLARSLSVAFPGSTLYVGASDMTPGHLWLLAFNSAALPAPIPLPGIGIANVAGLNFFTYSGVVEADGCAVQPIFLPPSVPSVSVYFQFFTFPGSTDLLESSLGLEVVIQ